MSEPFTTMPVGEQLPGIVVLVLTGPRSAEQSQKATFKVGSAKRLAVVVARDGPLLFQDPLNRSRDIYVQHLGDDDWQRGFEVTLLSAIRLTRRALPALRRSGRGRVVNITSMAVKEINDGLLLSNALRPGVTGWAKHLSREEGPHGITVNSIAPGYIDTDLTKGLRDNPKRLEPMLRQIPLGHLGIPADIVGAAIYLASDASSYVTGHILDVDGGWLVL